MDIWLIFHSFCQFINEVTYCSTSCRLLDFGKDIKDVGQENPSHTVQDIFRTLIRQGKKRERSTGKIFYTARKRWSDKIRTKTDTGRLGE